jgi:hypothetical protein
MAFDVSVALTWILFLALFPMAFFWLRRAWRILVQARLLRGGAQARRTTARRAERWAPYK